MLLAEKGYRIAGTIPFGDLTPATVEARKPDAVLINVPAPREGVLEAIRVSQQTSPRPLALFCKHGNQAWIRAAVAAGVSAYITDELTGKRVQSAIDLAVAQFSECQSLREQLDEAQTALSERKLIERAKGIVMKQRRLDEEDAFQIMRKTAMDRNLRLADLAKTLIEATEFLGERSP
jgi:response regulator NasT